MDTRFLDQARATRSGEELDLERLAAYLRVFLPASPAARAAAPLLFGPELGERASFPDQLVVEQFPSGYSNLTYLLRLGPLELVLRRPPFGNVVKSAHDMGREYRVLSALQAGFPQAPKPYLYCEDDQVIGAPFYVMERRRGIVLRQVLPPGLELPPARMAALCEALVTCLAGLHQFDYRAAGLANLGRSEGYVERQVQGWIGRYHQARTDEWPAFDAAAAYLQQTQPQLFPAGSEDAALIHNDFKFDNLLLDPEQPDQILGVFDWEMCTIGEPLLDLGTTLAYWVEAGDDPALRATAFGPTALPGAFDRVRLAEAYAARMGKSPSADQLLFAYVFGLYKLGVIVQQIYARYVKGLTRDPRFARLGGLVDLLGRVACAALDRGRL